MAWVLLPTDYTDAHWSGLKRYMQIENEDGSISLQDVTAYTGKEKSFFGAIEANRMNEAMNAIMSMVEDGTDLYGAFQLYFANQKTLFESSANTTQNEFIQYVSNLKAEGDGIILVLKNDYKTDMDNFKTTQKQLFDTWFAFVQSQLSGDVAGNLQNAIDTHKAQSILDAGGVHNLRYFDETLQVWNGTEWEDVVGGMGKIPVGDCININIIAGNGRLTISWTDPEDIVTEGVTLAAWRETQLVRKIGDYPENAADGTLVVSSSIRNQYAETGFTDTGLANGTVYYYKLVPISTTNAPNLNPANNISGSPALVIVPALPTQNGALTYTGGSLTPNWSGYNVSQLSIGGITTAVDAGTYTTSFTPTPGNQWWDGTVTAKTTTWKIDKAAGSLSLSPTSMTLNATTQSGAITVSKAGNGTVTAVSSNTNVATVTVNGNIITVNSVGQASGTSTITVSVAEGTNHLAPANKTCAVSAVFSMTFGVSINLGNSNPESAVTYTDDAIGMTAGSSAWDSMPIFKDIKPCMFKNGAVQYYLNPNNFAQKADGSAAVINGNDGDVMIEIPKTGYQIVTSGSTLTVKITSDPAKSGFKYYAHTRVTEGDREKLYIGAYHGQIVSSKLRSISGVAPTASQTIGAFRTAAKANGTGYDQLAFYPLTLLQCLFLIRFKNLNSQSALGRGYVDGNSAAINTGGTNAKGMYFGETTGKLQMKCFGIEDLWGNVLDWIDGLWSDASRNMFTAFQNFNDTGSGYTNRGQGATANIGNYMSKPQGTSETGFIAKEVTGSATTYFSDYAYLSASCLPAFGGYSSLADSAGVFYLGVYYSTSSTGTSLGARLMFL